MCCGPASHSGGLFRHICEGSNDEGRFWDMTSKSGPGNGSPDPRLNVIMSERRRLNNLAYRLLGSLAEAEDAVQETYARWYAMSAQQQDAVESPGGCLTRGATPHC